MREHIMSGLVCGLVVSVAATFIALLLHSTNGNKQSAESTKQRIACRAYKAVVDSAARSAESGELVWTGELEAVADASARFDELGCPGAQ